jgi:hypothetical protein
MLNVLAKKIVGSPALSRTLDRGFSPFDVIFTDIWQEYLLDHYAEISGKLHILCDGMDEISADIAATVADRYFHVAPPCRFNDAVLYRADRLFTNYEQTLQVEFEGLMKLREKRGY